MGAAIKNNVKHPNTQIPMFTKKAILFITALLFTYVLAGGLSLWAQKDEVINVGTFSSTEPGSGLPADWEALTFKNIKQHTNYSLVNDHGVSVVKAVSKASASGLIRKIEIDPGKFPIIMWRWKTTSIYEKGDVTRKEGDDYPARIYITFKYEPNKLGFFEKLKYGAIKTFYGEYPPLAAINYIWASKALTGTIVPNPYTDRAMMVVVESGKEKVDQWVQEKRNILEDYKKAFGHEPPVISGVALMTDSDNTRESTISFFGDIIFSNH
jgi:hypothetical protein